MQAPPSMITALSESYIKQRRELIDQALANPQGQGLVLAQRLSALTDRWLIDLWQEATREALGPEDAVLYALGGYGRQQLCPGSDLDVLIELKDPARLEDPALAPGLERWMTWVRQVRLKLALATRTIAQGKEQLELDVRTPIALLDARHLWGNDELLERGTGKQAALKHLRGQDEGISFVNQLIQGHLGRRQRHGQTIYLLEPDLKSGLGALRDLHTLHWAASVRWGIDVLSELDEHHGWDQPMQDQYKRALDWILSLRHQLHTRHERKHDRLHFADQEYLAKGSLLETYTETHEEASAAQALDESTIAARAERLMRAHYAQTRQGLRMTERLLRRWSVRQLESPTPINARFGQAQGQLYLIMAPQGGAMLEAAQVFEALKLAFERELQLEATLEQQLAQAIEGWGVKEREDPALIQAFLELLTHTTDDNQQGQRLLDLGVLVAMMPEFAPLWCHVQHDLYHVYTTDQHTIYCVERARCMLSATPLKDEVVARWPAFAQIAAQLRQPRLLILAALMHDVGKNRGGDHSRKGAQLVPEMGQRLGLEHDEIERLAFLVREHLCLSRTARRRDLSDVRVIRDLAAKIRSTETLNLLTALTFCDMSTVGAEVMNDWNAALLLQLHQRLKAFIEHGIAHLWQGTQRKVAALRQQLRQTLQHTPPAQLEGLSEQARQDLLDEFLRDVPFQSIAAWDHDLLLSLFETSCRRRSEGKTAMQIKLDEHTGVHELLIATTDRPGALAKLAGVLSASGLNILTAEILTTASGFALDLFRVLPQSHHSANAPPEPLSASRQQRLLELLWRVMDGDEDVEALLRQRQASSRLSPRQVPSVETSVEGLQTLSDDFTVLEIKTEDRTGLLFEIASTLHKSQLNTHFSKIDSLGNKIIDTFYVEDARCGGKLSQQRLDEVVLALEATLAQLHADAQEGLL